jgi:hypothetical protein
LTDPRINTRDCPELTAAVKELTLTLKRKMQSGTVPNVVVPGAGQSSALATSNPSPNNKKVVNNTIEKNFLFIATPPVKSSIPTNKIPSKVNFAPPQREGQGKRGIEVPGRLKSKSKEI